MERRVGTSRLIHTNQELIIARPVARILDVR
jgi:hypothetical protein